jgi:hypothetical protein
MAGMRVSTRERSDEREVLHWRHPFGNGPLVGAENADNSRKEYREEAGQGNRYGLRETGAIVRGHDRSGVVAWGMRLACCFRAALTGVSALAPGGHFEAWSNRLTISAVMSRCLS